jgi:hypothetical protein
MTVLFESFIEKELIKDLENNELAIGLLIALKGSKSEKQCVIGKVNTPKKEEHAINHLEDVDVIWFSEHTRQVKT